MKCNYISCLVINAYDMAFEEYFFIKSDLSFMSFKSPQLTRLDKTSCNIRVLLCYV